MKGIRQTQRLSGYLAVLLSEEPWWRELDERLGSIVVDVGGVPHRGVEAPTGGHAVIERARRGPKAIVVEDTRGRFFVVEPVPAVAAAP